MIGLNKYKVSIIRSSIFHVKRMIYLLVVCSEASFNYFQQIKEMIMHSQRKYRFFKDYIHILVICYLLLISFLLKGCSSNTDSAKIIELPADIKIESISAPKLVIKKPLYDFGEIKPNSKKTATFNFTNLGF